MLTSYLGVPHGSAIVVVLVEAGNPRIRTDRWRRSRSFVRSHKKVGKVAFTEHSGERNSLFLAKNYLAIEALHIWSEHHVWADALSRVKDPNQPARRPVELQYWRAVEMQKWSAACATACIHAHPL